MITYILTGDNIPQSDAIKNHIENHFKKFEKFVNTEASPEMHFTFSKSTAHERENSYHVEIKFKINSDDFVVGTDNADIFSAIDEAKDVLMREITKKHSKHHTLFVRGARKIKNLFKR